MAAERARAAALAEPDRLEGFSAPREVDRLFGHAAARGEFVKAESDARRATSWAPWSDQGWIDLAAALSGQGRHAEAAAALRTATRKDPVDWVAWRRLADQTTDPERFHALQMAAKLNPKATRRSLGHKDRVRLGLTGNQ